MENYSLIKDFKEAMTAVKDVERMLARCYTYSIHSQRQIVYEEMIWNLRLTEFRKTLEQLDCVMDIKQKIFENVKENFSSKRLWQLCTFKHVAEAPPAGALGAFEVDLRFDLEHEEGMFNNYTPILKPFQACIEWEKIENDRYMPRPMLGMDPEIDGILARMDAIKLQLKNVLISTRAKFNCDKIVFASNRKYRY